MSEAPYIGTESRWIEAAKKAPLHEARTGLALVALAEYVGYLVAEVHALNETVCESASAPQPLGYALAGPKVIRATAREALDDLSKVPESKRADFIPVAVYPAFPLPESATVRTVDLS